MTEAMLHMIQCRIDAISSNTEFDLKTLMGELWNSVQSKQMFGREFKKALTEGKLIGVMHQRLDNSPRRDIYKKL